jgi:hypothetical protein
VEFILAIHPKPTYLHATVTGRNSRENVEGYLKELYRECLARNCFSVLVEERLEGPRLNTLDVFHIASAGSSAAGRFDAFAYVDVNAEGDLMKFAETVAYNRGARIAVFSTVAAAEEWLLNRTRR